MNLAFSETPTKVNSMSNDNHHQFVILKSQKDKIEQAKNSHFLLYPSEKHKIYFFSTANAKTG